MCTEGNTIKITFKLPQEKIIFLFTKNATEIVIKTKESEKKLKKHVFVKMQYHGSTVEILELPVDTPDKIFPQKHHQHDAVEQPVALPKSFNLFKSINGQLQWSTSMSFNSLKMLSIKDHLVGEWGSKMIAKR